MSISTRPWSGMSPSSTSCAWWSSSGIYRCDSQDRMTLREFRLALFRRFDARLLGLWGAVMATLYASREKGVYDA